MAAPMNPALKPCFVEAIGLIFNGWTGLQLSIQNGMGGLYTRDKALWLNQVVENFFYENDDLYPDEVAEYLQTILDQEFDTICEDGSLEEVSSLLCRCYKMLQEGKLEELKSELQSLPGSRISSEAQVAAKPQTMDTDLPTHSKEADNDGWTVVSKKKR